jgi:general secretion pathway protein I
MKYRRSFQRARGFTLLEVMVSVAILGISLTAILSNQGGLSAANRAAEHMGVASTLARCKMTELEEKLIKNGYQEIDEKDTEVACCEGNEDARYKCDYTIEKVELPAPPSSNASDGGGLDFGGLLGGDGGGGGLNFDGGISGINEQVAAQTGGAGASGMLSMVFGMVYPSLKPVMEASIRRINVTVRWKEGPVAKELPITQFVTSPQRGGFLGGSGDGGAPLTDGGVP